MNKLSLENYNFIKTIGKGTFGKVKLALHTPTKEQVAIKILEKSKIKSKRDLERIEKEIKYLKMFNNPNIIKIYQIKEDEKNFYIVMEYVQGGELFNYIVSNKHLDENEASFFYSQIIHIIQEIHKHKICHRDMKPENLLLTQNKTIKLIDFGLSNEYEDLLETPCGSPCYASPEIIQGRKYSGVAIDLWASGIILFSMLCGYLPFDDKDNEVLFRKILKCKYEFPKNKKYKISDNAKDLIRKILTVDPKKRITLEEILEHPFLTYGNKKYKEKVNTDINKQDKLIIDYMVNVMKITNNGNIIRKDLNDNRHNNITTTFHLLKKKYNEGRLNYNLVKYDTGKYLPNSEYKNKLLKRFGESKAGRSVKTRHNYIDSSLVNDIGNIIKKKVNENNNNIIIINNNNNMLEHSQKMNYILNSIFDEDKKNNSNNNKNNRKLLKIIDTSLSVEKRGKENDSTNNKDKDKGSKNYSQSPTISDYKLKGFKYNSKIKGKRIFKKRYINTSINKIDNNTLNNETFNFKNRYSIIEKNIPISNIFGFKNNQESKQISNIDYYTLNKSQEKKNNNISIKNRDMINNLLYTKKDSKNDIYENSSYKSRFNHERSPEFYRGFNYFNYCTEAPKNKNNYEKLINIRKLKNNSLINEMNSSIIKNPELNEKIENEFRTINQENKKKAIYSFEVLNENKFNTIEKDNLNRKLNMDKLRDTKDTIRVNRLVEYNDKLLNNTLDESNTLSARERIPKSIIINKVNKSITYDMNKEESQSQNQNQNLNLNKPLKKIVKENTETKKFNKSLAYSRKICTSYNKPINKNNYIMLSSNLSIRQISNIINGYCLDNELKLQQSDLRYIITVKKYNSFVIEINFIDNSCVLKFMHENGDVNQTKEYMNKLFFEIAK